MPQSDFPPVHRLQVSFGHCSPLAAALASPRTSMEVRSLWRILLHFSGESTSQVAPLSLGSPGVTAL